MKYFESNYYLTEFSFDRFDSICFNSIIVIKVSFAID